MEGKCDKVLSYLTHWYCSAVVLKARPPYYSFKILSTVICFGWEKKTCLFKFPWKLTTNVLVNTSKKKSTCEHDKCEGLFFVYAYNIILKWNL
jgi:hypothetical protein